MSKIKTENNPDVQIKGVDKITGNDDPSTIFFTIQHPAHVHLFRNSIQELSEQGHNIYTFVREKEINTELLDQYEINYELLADEPKYSWQLPFVQIKYEWNLIQRVRHLEPDILVAMGEPAITHAAKLTDATSIIFTDTEHATLQNSLAFPFADRIYTPDCYQGDIGTKHKKYPSYHELAYLHPNRFKSDPSILVEANLDPDEQFVILRLVSWGAMHDAGNSGFKDVVDVVHALEERGVTVCITSEGDLPASIEDRQVSILPHRMHHLMYYADLFIGESPTMATESAVLGTPALYVSSIRLGYSDQLENKYDLVYNFSGPNRQSNAVTKAISIVEDYNQAVWDQRKERLIDDKIDTTKFIIEQIQREIDTQ